MKFIRAIARLLLFPYTRYYTKHPVITVKPRIPKGGICNLGYACDGCPYLKECEKDYEQRTTKVP